MLGPCRAEPRLHGGVGTMGGSDRPRYGPGLVPRCCCVPPVTPPRPSRSLLPAAVGSRRCSMSAPTQDAKTHLQVLQDPGLQPPAAEGDANPAAEPQGKSKKRKSTSNTQPCKKVPPRDALGRLPRLRPLYQYINLSTELMCPAGGEGEGRQQHTASTDRRCSELQQDQQSSTWKALQEDAELPLVQLEGTARHLHPSASFLQPTADECSEPRTKQAPTL
ncbi:uncharacterized protein LOC116653968 isoform X2 [Coturnix japonica]|uniref:uncharacterized protein LOC116653968 isoform X2 n=2 Tax=Coturnix japonica TaxID=93934 RepID=UPI0013A5DE31|nr:uncharacterized protein LOC116653968 isoform X2 [Coturnix japonica]